MSNDWSYGQNDIMENLRDNLGKHVFVWLYLCSRHSAEEQRMKDGKGVTMPFIGVFRNKGRLTCLIQRLPLLSLMVIVLCLSVGSRATSIASVHAASTCFEQSCDGLPVSQIYQAGAQPYGSAATITQWVQPTSPLSHVAQQVPAGTVQMWVNSTYHVVWAHVDAYPQANIQGIISIDARVCISQTSGYANCLNGNTLSHTSSVDSPLQGYHPGAHLTYQAQGAIMTNNGGSQTTFGPSFTP